MIVYSILPCSEALRIKPTASAIVRRPAAEATTETELLVNIFKKGQSWRSSGLLFNNHPTVCNAKFREPKEKRGSFVTTVAKRPIPLVTTFAANPV